MTIFIQDLRTEVLQRLGDTNQQIWQEAEVDRYIQDGYDVLTHLTGCVFGVTFAPDHAFAFNFTQEFEREYAMATSGWYVDGPAQFTTIFERDLIDNAQGPANHNEHWEWNQGYTRALTIAIPDEVSALVDLPDNLHDIERTTWNNRACAALTSRDVENYDNRYELNKGIVEGYFRDKDGINTLRKWRVPSSPYVSFVFDDKTSAP